MSRGVFERLVARGHGQSPSLPLVRPMPALYRGGGHGDGEDGRAVDTQTEAWPSLATPAAPVTAPPWSTTAASGMTEEPAAIAPAHRARATWDNTAPLPPLAAPATQDVANPAALRKSEGMATQPADQRPKAITALAYSSASASGSARPSKAILRASVKTEPARSVPRSAVAATAAPPRDPPDPAATKDAPAPASPALVSPLERLFAAIDAPSAPPPEGSAAPSLSPSPIAPAPSVSIGKIDITVAPPSAPATRPAPQRTKGFAGYAQMRRGIER